MKNEFSLAFNEVLEDKQLPKEIILQAIESAMVSAYRRSVNASTAQHIEAKVNPETGAVTIRAEKEVVESVENPNTEVALEEARKYNPEAEVGIMIVVDCTPKDFGRVAAQTARQVIQQRIRDAERQAQLNFYQKQLGEIVNGVVQAVNAQGYTIGLELRAEGFLSRKDTIPGERFRIHDRVRALVAEVKDNQRGPQIMLSRTHRDFLRRLLETEVPEIYHGVVEIRSIAREPGERAKVAVFATQSGIDPVGACVGMRGVRIQAIVRELHDEKIDVIEWNPDSAIFIAKAISPARVIGVYLNEDYETGKTATVVVPEDQLSLAIGRDGQNARLAAKLTGWRIDIKSLTEATSDTLHRLQQDESLAELAELESSNLEAISNMLAKKAEGRPLTPEEYDQMAHFVGRIEKRTVHRIEPEKTAIEEEHINALRQAIPEEVFEKNILDSGLPEHVAFILQEAGFTTVGELAVQMQLDADRVFRLQGIGPRAMGEIKALIDSLEIKRKPLATEAAVEEHEPEMIASPIEGEPAEAIAETAPEQPLAERIADETTGEAEKAVEEAEESEEEEPSFDELFSLKPELLDTAAVFSEDEDEETEDKPSKKGKKKKKKKHIEVEYDPDQDMTLVHRKHKRSDDDWGLS